MKACIVGREKIIQGYSGPDKENYVKLLENWILEGYLKSEEEENYS